MLKRGLKRAKNDIKDDRSTGQVVIQQGPVTEDVLGDTNAKDEAEEVLESAVLEGGEGLLDRLESQADTRKRKKNAVGDLEAKPVWDDDDDKVEEIEISSRDYRHTKYFKHQAGKKISGQSYSQTLKAQFEKVTGQPSWAQLKWQRDEKEEDSDDEGKDLLQKTGSYLSTRPGLPQGHIQIKACTDANHEQPATGKLKAVEFHPTAQVIMAGGMSQKLALFQVDGKNNPKIQSIFLDNFPIHTAHFTKDGSEVIMGSRHKDFYSYDMLAGQVVRVPKIKGLEENKMSRFVICPDGKHMVFMGGYGRMHLLSVKSKEWVCSMKMNGSVEAIAFSPDGTKMFSHGDDGVVYVWDMRTRDCVHRFTDDGCLKGTSIAVSKNGQYIATGSYSGVVNIYDESCLQRDLPQPVRAVMNLTTPCTDVAFNSTSEILAISSNHAENALKLIHFPSMTAFSNFPERSEPMKVPYCMDFSLNSGYFSIGNHKGQALLYRVKHFGNY